MEELIKNLMTLLGITQTPQVQTRRVQTGLQNINGQIVPLYEDVPINPTPSPIPVRTQSPMPVQTPTSDFAYYTRGQVPQNLSSLISQSAKQYGIDPSLLAATLFQESGISPNAKDNPNYDSRGNIISYDRGIAQINNTAHPEVSDSQAKNPVFAIPFMAKELATAYQQTRSWPQAIAAYNVGRGRVGYDSSRDQYGLGPKGRQYVSGVRANLDSNYANQIGLPNYGQASR